MKRPRVVEVTWIDSAFTRGWGDTDEKVRSMKLSECRTVGYLLGRSRREVKVSMSQADQATSFGDGMTIPSQCVTRVRFLT